MTMEISVVLTLSYTRYLLNEKLNIRSAARNEGITHAHTAARRRIYIVPPTHFAT